VKSVAHADGEPSLETATGLMPGTPAFMAPELALGDRYDGRADLYALGCVGYQLVTGRPVFDGDPPIHILAKNLHAPPLWRPSWRRSPWTRGPRPMPGPGGGPTDPGYKLDGLDRHPTLRDFLGPAATVCSNRRRRELGGRPRRPAGGHGRPG
jgi:serine/threonine protein kinase